MSNTLREIAEQLRAANKKVQLIYAFNGTGKTRLSREYKDLLETENDHEDESDAEASELSRKSIIYYNAFTEDLFYWDNDLDGDRDRKLKIHPNAFTRWVLEDQGQGGAIIDYFQRLTNSNVEPIFGADFSDISFVIRGDEQRVPVKISKGEESNLIWCFFYSFLELIVEELSTPTDERSTNDFNNLKYAFIDDPVSSLDDNHLIELAVDLAGLVKSSKSDIKFFITTHSPLFYNVLCNELSNKAYERQLDGTYKLTYNPNKEFKKHRLEKKADGLFQMVEQPTDSPFSYHLLLLSELQSAIKSGQIRKYHFNFLRNILEKMATFLGYNYWPVLLPKTDDGKPDPFANRILNLSSHSAHAGEEIADIVDTDKEKLDDLVKYLIRTYGFRKQEEQHG